MCYLQLQHMRCAFTCDVNKTTPRRSEDDARDEDKPSNQQKGDKIEHHQKSQKQEVRLDTTSKVPCGVREF